MPVQQQQQQQHAPPPIDPRVLVIGGAVVDIVYQATAAGTTTAKMHMTSTPCRRVLHAMGGVGRNIAEALARLGIPVMLLSVVGGVGGDSEGVSADALGQQLEQQLAAIASAHDEHGAAASYAASGKLQHLLRGGVLGTTPSLLSSAGASTGNADDTSCSNLISSSHCRSHPLVAVLNRIPGAATATYTALLDSSGEMAAASADMQIFDDHLRPDRLQLLAAHTLLLQATAAFDHAQAAPSSSSTPRGPLIPAFAGARGVDAAALAFALLTSVEWVVLEGNVPEPTVYFVCKELVPTARALRRKILLAAAATAGPSCINRDDIGSSYPKVALDPTSKQKALRALSSLSRIHLIKPNVFEAVELVVRVLTRRPNPSSSSSSSLASGGGPWSAVDSGRFPHTARFVSGLFAQTGGQTPNAPIAQVLDAAHTSIGRSPAAEATLAPLAAAALAEIAGIETVLCTAGKSGCWRAVRDAASGRITVDHIGPVPIPTSRIVKVTGAGDSFLSGYLFGTMASASVQRSVAACPKTTPETTVSANAVGTSDVASGQAPLRQKDDGAGLAALAVDFPLPPPPLVCAAHAAASALQSRHSVIHPRIAAFVMRQWAAEGVQAAKL